MAVVLAPVTFADAVVIGSPDDDVTLMMMAVGSGQGGCAQSGTPLGAHRGAPSRIAPAVAMPDAHARPVMSHIEHQRWWFDHVLGYAGAP